jgi:hypothetical protein
MQPTVPGSGALVQLAELTTSAGKVSLAKTRPHSKSEQLVHNGRPPRVVKARAIARKKAASEHYIPLITAGKTDRNLLRLPVFPVNTKYGWRPLCKTACQA